MRPLKKEKWDDLRMGDKYKLIKVGTASGNFELAMAANQLLLVLLTGALWKSQSGAV